VHNDYLNTLTDWGVVGAAIVTSAWVLLYAGVFKTWRFVRRTSDDSSTRYSNKLALVLGASVGLLAILVHSVVDFNMHVPANAILAVTLMALLGSSLRFATERHWRTAGLRIKWALTFALAAGFCYLSWQGVRRAREYACLERAETADDASPEQIAALQEAFSIEPQNESTACAIGEALRRESWQSGDDYKELAEKAMKWFKRGTELNRYDDSNYLGCGMCLDWIGKHAAAGPYFEHAVELDPNSYFPNAYMGWHQVQLGDYAAARVWLERSYDLEWQNNPIAVSYLQITTGRMLEDAFNDHPSVLPTP